MKRIPLWIWIVMGASVVLLFFYVFPLEGRDTPSYMSISEVLGMAQEGKISRIVVSNNGQDLTVTAKTGETIYSRKESHESITEMLRQRGIEGVDVDVEKGGGSFGGTLLSFLPLLLFGGFIIFMMRRSQSGMTKAMGIGKSSAKLVSVPDVRFEDVAGVDDA